jgi:hypothetical protein
MTPKSHFNNVEEFIADQLQLLPMLRDVERHANIRGPKAMAQEARKLLAMFEDDAKGLRAAYALVAKPDGSADFTFAPPPDGGTADKLDHLRTEGYTRR